MYFISYIENRFLKIYEYIFSSIILTLFSLSLNNSYIYIFFKTIYFSLFTICGITWNLLWILIDFELIDQFQFYLTFNVHIFLINNPSFSMVNQIRVDCDPLLRIRFRQRQLSRVTLALGKSCSTSKFC